MINFIRILFAFHFSFSLFTFSSLYSDVCFFSVFLLFLLLLLFFFDGFLMFFVSVCWGRDPIKRIRFVVGSSTRTNFSVELFSLLLQSWTKFLYNFSRFSTISLYRKWIGIRSESKWKSWYWSKVPSLPLKSQISTVAL